MAPGALTKRERDCSRGIPLPVLGEAPIAKSRMARWRAAVLIAIHVLIALHIAQWLVMGTTLTPVEPSESMQTLRDGLVNAGFVMFVVAIASTLIVGRFFCGWACHVVALQDLCHYAMKRLGVRPKPFRSRVLLWAPVGLAVYMFAWPVFHREVLTPLLADSLGRMPAWLGESRPWPGVQSAFMTHEFWETFPAWYVAVPFLAICGFATVYFLGSKGFCTYACPYGGVFAPIERVSPVRIRVDDNCHHCGHCTSVCTSNVRVHEEVRDFGMVVDPGCMKCMDCVSVCPNDALRLGVGAWAIGLKPRPGAEETAAAASASRTARYDPTLVEDLALGALMLALVLAFRGMLDQVPLLMAGGIAAIGTFGAWMTWRMMRVPSLRVQSVQLKFKGAMRPAGWVFVGGTVLALTAAAWSGLVRAALWRGDLAYAKLAAPVGVVLAAGFTAAPPEREAAERAAKLYRLADAPSAGGFGWPLRPDALVNLAYADLVLARFDGAEASLRELIARGRPADEVVFQLGAIMRRRGAATPEIDAVFREALARRPTLARVRSAVARGLIERGDVDGAAKLWEDGLAEHPDEFDMKIEAAILFAGPLRRTERARAIVEPLPVEKVKEGRQAVALAALWASLGEADRARAFARRAAEVSRARAPTGADVGACDALEGLGLQTDALEHARGVVRAAEARGKYPGKAEALLRSGLVERRLGDRGRGLALVREALDLVQVSPWDHLAAAEVCAAQARARGDDELGRVSAEAANAAAQSLRGMRAPAGG